MMLVLIFIMLGSLSAYGQKQQPGPQMTQGPCSPAIVNNGNGPLTITFQGSACGGINPGDIKRLNEFLAEYPKVLKRLLEQLDSKDALLAEKDATISDRVRQLDEWTRKYKELAERLAARPADDQPSKRAEQFVKNGDLERAATALVPASNEKQPDRTSGHEYELAKIAFLQNKPLEAQQHYETAHRLQPENWLYTQAYGNFLYDQRNYVAAEPILKSAYDIARKENRVEDRADSLNVLGSFYFDTERMREGEAALSEALTMERQLAKENPAKFLPDLARVLNNLGVAYERSQQRLEQSEALSNEALSIFRRLAKGNPAEHLPDVAMTLNSLGVLYASMQRTKEAEKAYEESVTIRRQLAMTNWSEYAPDLAISLGNLGILYSASNRRKEAESSYAEALSTYRQLVTTNSARFLPGVATILNNLGGLYSAAGRTKESEAAFTEALSLLRQLTANNRLAYLSDLAQTLSNLAVVYDDSGQTKRALPLNREAESTLNPVWQTNPAAHGDLMARILARRADMVRGSKEACGLAQRSFAAANGADVKQISQETVQRHCRIR